MNSYHIEQTEALTTVKRHLENLPASERQTLAASAADYLMSKDQVFGKNPELKKKWEKLEAKRKLFTWPDQPVLFDDLESYFMKTGCRSPLMNLHNSPGLLRVKQRAAAGIKISKKKW